MEHDPPEARLSNARKLYKAAQYTECVQYIDRHLPQWGNDRAQLSQVYCLQAQAYFRLGDYDKAMVCALRALEVDEKSKHAHYWLGNIYRELGFYRMAEEAYLRAIKLYPEEEYYYLNLASVYKVQNKLDQAILSYQNMLRVNPKSTKAYRNMSVCFKYDTIYHEHHEKILQLMLNPDINNEQKMECYFTLGKMYLDCEHYEEAYHFLQMANALRAQMVPFDLKAHKQKMEEIRKNFQLAQGRVLSDEGKGRSLVFVVGIPRSGKTLIERILVESGAVIGLGELGAFEKIMRKTKKLASEKIKSSDRHVVQAQLLDKEMTHYMAEQYLAEVKRRSFGENKIIVDTTPTNYQHIGLISRLFPEAKIIHCKRHPLDHILQIYFKYFAEGNGFSYDLVTLTHFYLEYRQLMSFWKENTVMPLLEINYDELVIRPRPNVAKICEFVGVSPPAIWGEIHVHESGLWRYYERYLEVVKAILKSRARLESF